jgi:hypothetical protein
VVKRASGKRYRRVGTRLYRDHRLELLDDHAEGWAVRIWPPGPEAGQRIVLRNHVPKGLTVLIEEAMRHIDRRLDGTATQD